MLEYATQLLAFGAILLAILFAFLSLWVAGMDVHVALALVTQTSLTTAFQAMALTLLPPISVLGSIALFYVSGPPLRRGLERLFAAHKTEDVPWTLALEPVTVLVGPLIGVAAAGLLLWPIILRWPDPALAPISFVVNVLGMLPILGILILRFMHPFKRPAARSLPGIVVGLVALSVASQFASAFTSSSMWLPPEQVRTAKGSFVMYALSTDDRRMVAFIPANRAVLQIPIAEVRSRQFCSPYFTGDVATALWGPVQSEPCVDVEGARYPLEGPPPPIGGGPEDLGRRLP